MSITEESSKVKNAIEKMVGAQIETATNNCVRLFKAVVVTAPNATTKTIGVKKIGDDTILDIPYATAVKSSTVGSVVWLMQCYGTRNLIAWLPFDMDISSVYKRHYTLYWSNTSFCNIYIETSSDESWTLSHLAEKIRDLGCTSVEETYPATYKPATAPIKTIMLGVWSNGDTITASTMNTERTGRIDHEITSMEETIIEL